MKLARARAHSNIALIKYWGKRPSSVADLNLPAVSSLSMTLSDLRTETAVSASSEDRFILDGRELEGSAAAKVFAHLDRIWSIKRTGAPRPRVCVDSTNYLPTAAGLASSASGFAALTLAGAAFYELGAGEAELTALARRGSGSAARSLFGGFVLLSRGEREDGADVTTKQVHAPDFWDVRLLVVHTARGQKSTASTGGMERCRETSPYYPAWVATSEDDIATARKALAARDLAALGEVMEHSCFKMHACMLATRPPLVYWNGATLEVIHALWQARKSGLLGYATSDAGPHVKVLCHATDAAQLSATLALVPGVHEVQIVAPGPAPTVEVFG
jgi:diphosphomevalonate decarboxylase